MDSRKSASDALAKALSQDRNGRIGYNRDNTLIILVMGETGAGKSTWINGVANYVAYGDLAAAQLSNDPKWKIPSRFTLSDNKYKVKTIYVGPPEGNRKEKNESGESGTTFPEVYEFTWNKKRVIFIDTPGTGDSAGLPQDFINFNNNFRFIEEKSIGYVNAVIMLMKPDQKVFTPAFKYCISELFTRLPKTWAKNVLFGFTNTRSSCYRAGETLDPLLRYLATIEKHQKVSLKVDTKTTFCFDNEAFRFLFASLPENRITFTEEERKNYAASWDRSAKETQRFFERVSKLPPRDTGDLIALNEARRYISMLSQPLASISATIQLKIKAIDKEVDRINSLDIESATYKEELIQKHEKEYYVSEKLPNPRTVCTGRDCFEMVKDKLGTSQPHYKTLCHDECGVPNVKLNATDEELLKGCKAMNGTDNCTECGCHWSLHKHVTYWLTKHNETVETVNKDVQKQINECESNKKARKLVVEPLQATLKECQAEEKMMGDSAAMLGAFLKDDAIMPFNDGVEKQYEQSLQQAKNVAEQTQDPADIEHVETLCKWLERYKQQKKYILTGKANGCTLAQVKAMCDKLVNLKHSGPELKELLESEKREMEATENHMRRGAQSHSAGNQPSTSRGSNSRDSHISTLSGHLSSAQDKMKSMASSVKDAASSVKNGLKKLLPKK